MAACGIVYEDGELLLLRDLQGFWSAVGGWIDPGETPEETVVREVREELGVEATVTAHFRPFIAWNVAEHDHPISFLLFPHRIRLASRDFTLQPTEVTDVAWVSPHKLADYEMREHPRKLLDDRLDEWLAHPERRLSS